MTNRRQIYILSIILLLILGFVLRLTLRDMQSSWYAIIQDVTWILSALVLILFFSNYKKTFLSFFKEAKGLNILVIAFLIMESSFMIKNATHIGMSYPFGLLLSLWVWLMIFLLLPPLVARIWGVFSICFFTAYTIGQDVYLRIFKDYFSFKEALTLREGLESGESMYRFNFLHLFVLLVMVISIYFYLKTKQKKMLITFQKVKTLHFSLLVFILLVLLNVNSRISLPGQTKFTSDFYLYQSVYSRQEIAQRFGFFHLMGRDIIDTLSPVIGTKKDVLSIDSYFEENPKYLDTHSQSGIFENKNLIFILAESYDEIALDPLLTPHLYKLKSEGFSFNHHFTPVFQRTTSDTEFIFNTGLLPSIDDGPTVTVFKENSYSYSLASLFKSKGYLTQAFHGNYKEFYSRQIIYDNYGYDAFYGRDELGLNKTNNRFDTVFFESAKDLILPNNTPFMSFIITFSGHSPYTDNHLVVNERINEVTELYPNDHEIMNNYRATQLELDAMIGLLFDALIEKNLLDETVIVLSGDHYPYTMPEEVYSIYAGVREDYLKQTGNLYIWNPDISHLDYNNLSTSFDILPTINSLFNLEGNPTYYIGRDLFSTQKSLVLYKNFSYYNDINYTFLKDPNATSDEAKYVEEIYFIYKKILRTNYFKRGNQ